MKKSWLVPILCILFAGCEEGYENADSQKDVRVEFWNESTSYTYYIPSASPEYIDPGEDSRWSDELFPDQDVYFQIVEYDMNGNPTGRSYSIPMDNDHEKQIIALRDDGWKQYD